MGETWGNWGNWAIICCWLDKGWYNWGMPDIMLYWFCRHWQKQDGCIDAFDWSGEDWQNWGNWSIWHIVMYGLNGIWQAWGCGGSSLGWSDIVREEQSWWGNWDSSFSSSPSSSLSSSSSISTPSPAPASSSSLSSWSWFCLLIKIFIVWLQRLWKVFKKSSFYHSEIRRRHLGWIAQHSYHVAQGRIHLSLYCIGIGTGEVVCCLV